MSGKERDSRDAGWRERKERDRTGQLVEGEVRYLRYHHNILLDTTKDKIETEQETEIPEMVRTVR